MAAEQVNDTWVFLGRLHVVTVHFPIALLIVGGLLELLERRAAAERAGVGSTVLRLGALSGLVVAALGWLHAWAEPQGSSVQQTLDWHRWTGSAAALLACFAAWLRRPRALRTVCVAATVASVVVAGHLGGELTYGPGYLLGAFEDELPAAERSPADSEPPAIGFEAGVLPIFREHCVECHGPSKQKGKLRLDRAAPGWFEPGEYATVIVRGAPEQSELVRRLLLPPNDDDHMPPAKKPQPTAEQIALLQRWIRDGAPLP